MKRRWIARSGLLLALGIYALTTGVGPRMPRLFANEAFAQCPSACPTAAPTPMFTISNLANFTSFKEANGQTQNTDGVAVSMTDTATGNVFINFYFLCVPKKPFGSHMCPSNGVFVESTQVTNPLSGQ